MLPVLEREIPRGRSWARLGRMAMALTLAVTGWDHGNSGGDSASSGEHHVADDGVRREKEPGRKPEVPSGWEALLIGSTCVVAAVLLFWWAASQSNRPAGPTRVAALPVSVGSRYVGSRSCGECHPGASAAHHFSGHDRTLRPAGTHPLAARLDGRSIADPERPGVRWTFALHGDELSVERAEGGRVDRQLIEYALGSGRHAMTFVTRLETDPEEVRIREHRLTYFAHTDALGITPGQEAHKPGSGTNSHGRDLPTGLSLKCISCHVTLPAAAGFDRFEPATAITQVDCERCHGPARAHVESARRGETDLPMPFGPDRWTADEQMRLCGECHRHPEMIPAEALRPENTVLTRFQPVGLMQSACYTGSAGALSCTTCHDAHSRTSRDRVAYEQTCRSCHGGDSNHQSACPVSPRGGCIDCHMPQRDTERGLLFTDHWIRIPDRTPALEPAPTPSQPAP